MNNEFEEKTGKKFTSKKGNGKGRSGKGSGRSNNSKHSAKRYDDDPRGSKTKRDYSKDVPSKEKDRESGINDPDWYYINDQIGYDSANLPWAEALGLPVNDDYYFQDSDTTRYPDMVAGDSFNTSIIPGVLALEIAPAIGISLNNTSAVNIAADSIFKWMRKDNSGFCPYEKTETMMYILMTDQLYSIHAWLCRLYGLMRIAAQKNRYVPRALIHANCVDYNDLMMHVNDLRGLINIFGTQISQFAVPTVFPYIKRHSMMFRDVYADNDISKPQYYMYVPAFFWKFVEKTTEQAAYLQPYPIGRNFSGSSNLMTFNQIKAFVTDILSSVISAESMAIISGDILKAYGESNLYVVPMLDENYFTLPVYSEELLMQIHNAKAFKPKTNATYSDWRVTQVMPASLDEDGSTYLKYDPTFAYNSPVTGGALISVDSDTVDYKTNLVYTRLTASPKKQGIKPVATAGTESIGRFDSCGSEICVGMNMWTRPLATAPSSITLFSNTVALPSGTTAGYAPQAVSAIAALASFTHHPPVCIWGQYLDANNLKYWIPTHCRIVDNYTVISPEVIKKLHECALLGEFRTPQLGTQEL